MLLPIFESCEGALVFQKMLGAEPLDAPLHDEGVRRRRESAWQATGKTHSPYFYRTNAVREFLK